MKSPLYYFPTLYEFGIPFKHSKGYKKKIEIILDFISKYNNPKIVELGSGTGKLQDYIKQAKIKATYYGFDLNKKFVKFGRKRHRNIIYEDVFEVNLKSFDIIVACDILHHLPNHKELLNKIFEAKKPTIICEPVCKGSYSFLDKLTRIIDADGINHIPKWYNNIELKKIFGSVDIKPDIIELKESIIAMYDWHRA